MNETAILINVRDRPTEIALLLQSLRTQNYQHFDIFILDDMSGTPLVAYHFFNCIVNRLKLENHKVFLKRTEFIHGVSRARQAIVDWALAAQEKYKYLVRVDDDVVLEPDYLGLLRTVIAKGYDIASGVTVPMVVPTFKRNPRHLGGVVNRVVLDDEGNYVWNGDDCGMEYTESVILPAHHFRSCAMIKREVHEDEKVFYYPTRLSNHGFREEQIFSYRAIMAGYKIGVNTGAVNYHQLTPSGGERPTQHFTIFNEEIFLEFTKKHKDKLKEFFPDMEISEQEKTKETNCRIK